MKVKTKEDYNKKMKKRSENRILVSRNNRRKSQKISPTNKVKSGRR